jgi:hypothetical protein
MDAHHHAQALVAATGPRFAEELGEMLTQLLYTFSAELQISMWLKQEFSLEG